MGVMERGRDVLRELDRTLAAISTEEADRFLTALMEAPRVFVAGAGRSGLAVKAFAMRLMHMGRQVFVVGEIVTPGVGAGDLLIVGSGSGETASLRTMAERAKSVGAKVALVTIFPDSSIGRIADVVVTIPAPTPKSSSRGQPVSIQPMGSLFEQSMAIFFDLLVLQLMENAAIDSAAMFERHANLE
jgi:6-phospho-3-hexuloisomerase